MNKKIYPKAQDSFKPEHDLKSVMQDLLQWELLEKSINEKMSAGGGRNLTKEEIEHNNLDSNQKQKEKDRLDNRKFRALNNYVFRSMANLVVFFEIAANPELRETFEKDIQALFFGVNKRTIDETDAKKTDKDKANANVLYRFINDRNVFYRLISAILVMSKDTKLTDFRFILSNILQKQISDVITSATQITQGKFNDDSLFHNVITPLSVEAQAHSATIKLSNKRPVLF